MKTYKKIILAISLLICSANMFAQDSDIRERFSHYQINDTTDTIIQVLHKVIDAPTVNKELQTPKQLNSQTYSNSNGELHPHIANSATPDKSKIVGAIPISEGTSPSGAKTYTIPIEISAGRNGVQPNLSIVYNSQGGNSAMGKGWTLGGLSAITRGNYSIYYDGYVAAIKNNTNDPFYLDGMRLIKVSTNKYQSEQGNIKVDAIVSGSVIKYFKVWYPNGNIGIYGYTSNTSNKQVYPIIEMKDNNNNIIDYSYIFENNQYRISQINYGENGSIQHFASVVFNYTNRTDTSFGWHLGEKISNNKLISSITCKDGSNSLRVYSFTYSGQSQSVLSQINCTANGSALNPIKCHYGDGNASNLFITQTTALNGGYSDEVEKIVKSGRFSSANGDGLIVYPKFNAYSIGYLYGNKIYTSQYHKYTQLLVYTGLDKSVTSKYIIDAEDNFVDMFAADIDGKFGDEIIKVNYILTSDGKDKVSIKAYRPNQTMHYRNFIHEESALFPYDFPVGRPKQYFPGDFDGDGRHEVFAVSINDHPLDVFDQDRSKCYLFDINDNQTMFSSHVFEFNSGDIILTLDYDGDGKTDVGLLNNSGLHIYTFNTNGATYSMPKIATYTGITKNTISSRNFIMGDINGDGKQDFMVSPLISYSYTRYDKTVFVNAPAVCDYCGMPEPVEEYNEQTNNVTTQFSYYCQHCNELFPGLTTCRHPDCNELLPQPYYGNWTDDSVIECPRHGMTMNLIDTINVNRGNTWSVFYNKGNGQFDKQTVSLMNRERNDKYYLQDMNNDGQADFILQRGGKGNVYLSHKGNITTSALHSRFSMPQNATTMQASVLGDKFESRIITLNNNIVNKIQYGVDENVNALLSGVINSYGVVSKNKYLYMNRDYPDTTYYVRGNDSDEYPYQNFNGAVTLITQSQSWLNNNKLADVSYRYRNALLHLQGLGFRGFAEIHSTDNIRELASQTNYDPYKFGAITMQDSRTAKVDNICKLIVAPNKIAKLTLTKTIATDKLKNNTITTTYGYDSYNNPTSESINYGNGILTSTAISYTNTNTSSKYIIGQPLSKTISKSLNGTSFVDKTTYTYENYRPKTITTYANNNQTGQTTYTYDTYGNVVSESQKAYSSAKTFTTSYVYDSKNRRPQSTTNAMGQTTTYTYNSIGLLTNERDFKGNTTAYTYDALGRATQSTLPTGEVNSVIYAWESSSGDMLYNVTSASNIVPITKECFDALGRSLRKSSVALNGVWAHSDTEYNYRGQVYRQSTPYKQGDAKLWTTYAYDYNNRVSSVTTPSGARTSYAYSGNTVTTTNDGRESSKTTNARGDLISATDEGGTISYRLRADGQPTSINSGGVQTVFIYDNYGRRTQIIDPSAGTITYAYDADGNIYREIDAEGNVTTRSYDQYNRLISEAAPEITNSYTYNADGMLTAQTSNNGTGITYSYNNLLQLTSLTETVDGQTYTESHQYSNGRLASTTYAPINYTVSYMYTSNKHLYQLKNGSSVIWTANTDNAMGNITQQTYGNGVVVKNNYNSYGLPTEIKATRNGSTLQHFAYDFDPQCGNLRSRSDQRRNMAETFGYDYLDRLISSSALGVGSTTEYYDNGNIRHTSSLGNYQYSTQGKPYALSGIENTSGAVPTATQDIEYASFKRPTSISENGNSVSYKYNGAFQRAKAITNSLGNSTTSYIFANGSYEKHVSGSTTKQRLYVGGTPYSAPIVIEKTGSAQQTYYLHRDYLGSITGISNQSGALVEEYSYTAWGLLRNPATWQVYSSSNQPQLIFGRGYTGHEHLQAFGLINMNARLYDPAVGRFLSPDPYVQMPDFTQNFNRYSYALNNPLVYVDESGEIAWLIIGAAIFGTANLAIQAANGEIDNFWDGAKAFGAGAIAGATITAGVIAGLGVPLLGSVIKGAGIIYGSTTALSAVNGLGVGIFTGDWSILEHTAKIFAGNFYLDSDRSLFGQVWQGISRYSWELPQSTIGHGFSQLRNAFGAIDRVDYFGGATFATDVKPNATRRWGISLGNHIGIQRIDDSFDVLTDPLLMHEYGHTFDSQIFGLTYLLAVGIPSISGAEWTELRANRHAERYFGNRFGVNWADYLKKYPLNR